MKLLSLLLILVLINCHVFAQQDKYDDDRTVAKVGNDKITVEEFSDRYEFSPHPRKTNSLDTALVKKEYLYTLIAEKLLAQKAKELKLDTAKDVKGIMSYMERLFIRDAYFKTEVTNRVKITKKDMAEAERRYSKVLLVKYLYSKNENEINILYKELQNGTSLDSLLINRPKYSEQKTLGTVTFGTLDETLEDSLYNLQPGQFTAPLKAGDRWYIFKLYRITNKPVFNTSDLNFKLKKIIEKRKTEKRENDFLYDFLHKRKVDVDRKLFFKIAHIMDERLKRKEASAANNRSKFITLYAPDFDEIIKSLDNEVLESSFIKFDHDPETVKEFLTQLGFNNFRVDSTDFRTVAAVFNNYVKDYIQSELLVRAAYKLGIQNSVEVKNDGRIWEDYYLSQKLERVIYDSISITNKDAYSFFAKNHNLIIQPEQVDVEEILVDNLDESSKVLTDLNNGLPFRDAAKKYSVLDSLKMNEEGFGYFPVIKRGKIGEIAAKLKIGEVYGPIKISDGYAIIKLIGKKQPDNPKDTTFAGNKREIIQVMKKFKMDKIIKNYVAQLAVDYGVKINHELFHSIPILRMNTVTIRLIGFGGKIYAFPYTPLFAGWYNIYLKKEKEVLP